MKIYIFCNNSVIEWPLVSKHKHVSLHGYWRNGIVSSCISSYKCSHLLYEGKIYNRLQANLYVEKFHIHLLSKGIALSWCVESNGANGSLIRSAVIHIWNVESHLPQDFRHTRWIPNRGIEWKMCIKKGFQWVVQVCLGRFHVGTLATHSQSRNLKCRPLCTKIRHSLYWAKP